MRTRNHLTWPATWIRNVFVARLIILGVAPASLQAQEAPSAGARLAEIDAKLHALEGAAAGQGDAVKTNCIRELMGQFAALQSVANTALGDMSAAQARGDNAAVEQAGIRLTVLLGKSGALLSKAAGCRGGKGAGAAGGSSDPGAASMTEAAGDGSTTPRGGTQLEVDDGNGTKTVTVQSGGKSTTTTIYADGSSSSEAGPLSPVPSSTTTTTNPGGLPPTMSVIVTERPPTASPFQ